MANQCFMRVLQSYPCIRFGVHFVPNAIPSIGRRRKNENKNKKLGFFVQIQLIRHSIYKIEPKIDEFRQL
jgi:hypothetical protein